MKLGREAKAKISDPEKIKLVESLVEVSSSRKAAYYTGIYFDAKINYWFSTDGFRLFAVNTDVLPGHSISGKFIPKAFAESLACEEVPEASKRWLDISQIVPKDKAKKSVTLEIPRIVGAADDKNYEGHMTLNFENDGDFVYLGKLPPQKLATDHIHFNMCNWNHLGGYAARVLYYDPSRSITVLPVTQSKQVLESPWFSLIMPTKDPGQELVKAVEMV